MLFINVIEFYFCSIFLSVLKPFIEISIVKRLTEHSSVQQYKYYKALVQEFHVKVDIGFLNAILAFFEAEEVSDADEVKNLFIGS